MMVWKGEQKVLTNSANVTFFSFRSRDETHPECLRADLRMVDICSRLIGVKDEQGEQGEQDEGGDEGEDEDNNEVYNML